MWGGHQGEPLKGVIRSKMSGGLLSTTHFRPSDVTKEAEPLKGMGITRFKMKGEQQASL